jgi:hypothetical protein
MLKDLQIKEYLISLEEKLLNPDIRKSDEELFQLLSDDYLEFGVSGNTYNKKDTIETLKREPSGQISVLDLKVNLLTPKIALITYTAVKKDNPNFEIVSLRSSLWKKTGKDWQIVFHRGSHIQK